MRRVEDLQNAVAPADFLSNNNNVNINENKNTHDDFKNPANFRGSFRTTRPKKCSIVISGEAILLLTHLGITLDSSSGMFFHKNQPLNLNYLSTQPGYSKAKRTFQNHAPYADAKLLKSHMDMYGPQYVLSYILYMDQQKNPATVETYTLYQAEMHATRTFMSGGIRENQKLVKNFDVANQKRLIENKRRDFANNHKKDKLLDPELYPEMFIKKYVDVLHDQLYAMFKEEFLSPLVEGNETSEAKMEALHAYMKNNPSDFERLKKKVFDFLETAYQTNQCINHSSDSIELDEEDADSGSHPLEKEPVNETAPPFGSAPKGPVLFLRHNISDSSQPAHTRDTPKLK